MKNKELGRGVQWVHTHVIWLGDFNSHHPLWYKARNSHLFTRASLDRAQTIIEVVANYDLQMILPKDVSALQAMAMGNLTRMDNVFASSSLTNAVMECRAVPEEWLDRTDHFPIVMEIETGLDTVITPVQHNFKATNWQVVWEEMALGLLGLEEKEEVDNKTEFYPCCHALTNGQNQGGHRKDCAEGKAITLHKMLVVVRASEAAGRGQETSQESIQKESRPTISCPPGAQDTKKLLWSHDRKHKKSSLAGFPTEFR